MTSYFKTVEKNLHKYYGNNVDLYESTRKDKKFMVISPEGKLVHFGARDYPDYYLDVSEEREERRKRFLARNKRWANAKKYTPAHLAYFVLWN